MVLINEANILGEWIDLLTDPLTGPTALPLLTKSTEDFCIPKITLPLVYKRGLPKSSQGTYSLTLPSLQYFLPFITCHLT